jgi:AcrR family transcriptional regulator
MSVPTGVAAPLTEQAKQERGSIIRAAHRLIGRDGTRSTSIQDILQLAGVNRRIFYRHFDSKDDLVLAMQAQASETVLRALRAATNAAADPAAAVVAWIEQYLGIGWDDHRSRDGRTFLSPEVGLTAGIAGALEDTYARHRQILADVLTRGQEDRSLPGARPESDAFAIHAVVLRHLEARIRGHLDLPYTRVRDDVVDLFLAALVSRTGGRE